MTDLTKRVETLERRLLPQPDQEWYRGTKLGFLWMSVGIMLGAILEQKLYGLDRMGIPPYWHHREDLIQPYIYFLYGIPACALVLAIFLFLDYIHRRKVNKRQRTLASKIRRLVFYVLMLAGGVVGFTLLAQSVESTIWRNFMGVI